MNVPCCKKSDAWLNIENRLERQRENEKFYFVRKLARNSSNECCTLSLLGCSTRLCLRCRRTASVVRWRHASYRACCTLSLRRRLTGFASVLTACVTTRSWLRDRLPSGRTRRCRRRGRPGWSTWPSGARRSRTRLQNRSVKSSSPRRRRRRNRHPSLCSRRSRVGRSKLAGR